MLARLRERVGRVVAAADLFGAPFHLLYKRRQTYQSFCGGTVTLVTAVVFLGLYMQSLLNVVNKVNASSSITTHFSSNQSVTLSSPLFFLAVGINGLDLSRPGPLAISLSERTRLPNGSSALVNSLPLKPCSRDSIVRYGQAFGEMFDSYNMTNYLCFLGQSLPSPKIVGGFHSKEYRYIKASVTPCQSCGAQLSQVMGSAGYIQVQLIFPGPVPSLNNGTVDFNLQPKQQFLRFVPFVNQISHDLLFSKATMLTDTSYLPFPNLVQADFFTFQGSVSNSLPGNYLEACKVFIRLDSSYQLIQRKVDSLANFLSFVGGLFNAFFIIGGLLVTPYNHYKMLLSLFARVSYFPSDQAQQQKVLQQNTQPELCPPETLLKRKLFQHQAGQQRPKASLLNCMQLTICRWAAMLCSCAQDKLLNSKDLCRHNQGLRMVQSQLDFQTVITSVKLFEQSLACLLTPEQRICLSIINRRKFRQPPQKEPWRDYEMQVQALMKVLDEPQSLASRQLAQTLVQELDLVQQQQQQQIAKEQQPDASVDKSSISFQKDQR